MASEVDICNLGLGHLGDSATVSSIDPPEGSAQAEHCQRFYPVARDALLEMHNWGFATRRTTLSLLSNAPSTAWAYAYAEPSNCAAPISILAPSGRDQDAQLFERESLDSGGLVIYTNQEEAILRYIARVTDTTRFSALFIDALSWLLASYLAGPIIKGDAGKAAALDCFRTFLGQLGRAGVSDANRRRIALEHMPSSIAARGAGFLSQTPHPFR